MFKDQNALNIKTFSHDPFCSHTGIATMFFKLCILFYNHYYYYYCYYCKSDMH